MAEKNKKWIPVAADAEEAEPSVKRVVSSKYVEVRTADVDEGREGSTRVHYELRGMWKDVLSYEGTDFDTLKVPDAGRMQDVGSPEIPQEGLFVAVPENAEPKEVRVLSKTERELDGEFYILPASKPVLEGEEPEYIPDREIYESDEPFPGRYAELLGAKHVAGRKVAHVLVYLLQYRPLSRRVSILESIDLEVTYETRPGMDAVPRRQLLRKSPLEDLILDSDSISEGERSSFDAMADVAAVDVGLKNANNRGEFLIITTPDLQGSVTPLVAAKRKDHTVKVVTTDEILAEFPQPATDRSIRDFLIYAVSYWYDPPEWVVLAGDTNKIPTHMTHYGTPDYTANSLASDHYYADLFGDLVPEVAVARLPVSSPQDMERLCNLAASYATQSGTWRKNLLLTAYQSAGYIQCKDNIASTVGTRFTVSKKYAGQATKQQVKDALNTGVVIVNYRGHGGDTSWSASNGLNAADVQGLTNAGRLPLVFSIACWNAHIDMAGECFGETWLRNEKTVAFLGATRPSFTSPNHDFDEYLFDAIVSYRLTTVGDIVNWAKTKLLLNYSPASLAEDNVRMYLILGDPTAGVYFIGNRRTRELHVSDCRWVDRMARGNKVYFTNIQEAVNLRYNGCYYCLRRYNTG